MFILLLVIKMIELEAIKEGTEVLKCQYCWQEFKWSYHYFIEDEDYHRVSAEQELKSHEEHCLENPNCPEWKLHLDITRCQCEARIYHCLNGQHYQKKCKGTKR